MRTRNPRQALPVFILLAVLCAAPGRAGIVADLLSGKGEVAWTLRARYGVLELGHVYFTNLKRTNFRGARCSKVRAVIRSSPQLGLIYVYGEYTCLVDNKGVFTRNYRELTYRTRNSAEPTVYYYGDYDYDNGLLYYERRIKDKDEGLGTMELQGPTRDGISILLWVRDKLGDPGRISTLVLLEEGFGRAYLNVPKTTVAEKVGLPKKKASVDCYLVEGFAEFTDFLGFGKQFQVYYTKHGEPLKVVITLNIGNVVLENVKYYPQYDK